MRATRLTDSHRAQCVTEGPSSINYFKISECAWLLFVSFLRSHLALDRIRTRPCAKLTRGSRLNGLNENSRRKREALQ